MTDVTNFNRVVQKPALRGGGKATKENAPGIPYIGGGLSYVYELLRYLSPIVHLSSTSFLPGL